jgi:phosphoglycolate phosphatase-like HAD superfamily hydrolase
MRSAIIPRIVSVHNLKKAEVIFWDFDGVIKESVEVKSDAFEHLFSSFGKDISQKIRLHHEANGGISRFDKLPIYLKWVGYKEPSWQLINEFADKFSELVRLKVVKSEWVLGVLDYLKNNYNRQQFFIVTATPQNEIEEIVNQLSIADYFKQIIGSPTKKSDAIKMLLSKYSVQQEGAIMVGDSSVDYQAAILNKVPFFLRKTNFNKELQKELYISMIENFS